MLLKKISDYQAKYYGDLFDKNGVSVDAVASGLQVYKDLRYKKLSAIFSNDISKSISLHDVGFGLGHYQKYIVENFAEKEIKYSGSEVTESFVEYANKNLRGEFFFRDLSVESFPDKYDYLIFGGTFYHLAGATPEEYEEYLVRTIKNAFAMCNKGVAFNLITEFVQYKQGDLFYADIHKLMQFIVSNLSRFITISHDYPLFEHTVFIYKPEYISSLYTDTAFDKYFAERKAATI